MYQETITAPQPEPTLHEIFHVEERVILHGLTPDLDDRRGRIVGIGSAHIIFQYIIRLDTPLQAPKEFPGEPWECVLISGGCLRKETLPE